MNRYFEMPETYLERVRSAPMLEASEELELARQWRDGDRVAGERIAAAHLRFAVNFAWNYRGYGAKLDDLVSCANEGIAEALKRFDPSRGFRFSTYAGWWIREKIYKHSLANHSLVKFGTTEGEKKVFFGLARAMHKLNIRVNRDEDLRPGDVERIAEHLQVPQAEVQSGYARLRARDWELDAPITGPEGETTWLEMLTDERESVEDALVKRSERREQVTLLSAALAKLTERDRDILVNRRLREPPLILDDLSRKHGVSRERIRQIEEASIEKLRKWVAQAARDKRRAA